MISNTATALILIPIALSAAAELNVSPKPVLLAVSVSCAAALLTPVSTPANLMVMEPGGYKFADYPKFGLPILALYGVVAVFYIPLIWCSDPDSPSVAAPLWVSRSVVLVRTSLLRAVQPGRRSSVLRCRAEEAAEKRRDRAGRRVPLCVTAPARPPRMRRHKHGVARSAIRTPRR